MGKNETIDPALARIFQDEATRMLDAMTPAELAFSWARQSTGRGGSKDQAAIYQIYATSQPESRRLAIIDRYNQLTSQEGAGELEELTATQS